MAIAVFLPVQSYSQLAAGQSKFLGNLYGSSAPAANWISYWNQMTPENSGKWGSVEATRNVYAWSNLDLAYNYATSRSLPFKHHNLVWGQQQPSWMTGLDTSSQRQEVEQWIQLVGQRYPELAYVDVVNEPLVGHSPPSYKNAIGGDGATGWDWVIWSFQKARQYCSSNVKLLLNDYNVLSSSSNTATILQIANLLKDRNLIDGIGEQGHFFETTDTNIIKTNLNLLAATGLSIYITEFDINIADDAQQLAKYQQLFPILWNHPSVKGITLWGYVQGQVWRTDSYLVRSNGTERPALQWLRSFFAALPIQLVSFTGTHINNNAVRLDWRTISEVNNLGFYVQRKSSGESEWFEIPNSFQPGHGTTNVPQHYLYMDSALPGGNLQYRLKQVDLDGPVHFSDAIVVVASTYVREIAPRRFSLSQNYPNPFNPSTEITFSVETTGHAKLEVSTTLGQKVATLFDDVAEAGHSYKVRFSTNSSASGLYFYKLQSGPFSEVKKMILTK